jgi:hypothetical protein
METKIIAKYIIFIIIISASIFICYKNNTNLYICGPTIAIAIGLLYVTNSNLQEQFKFDSDIQMHKSSLESKTDCTCGLDGNCICKNIECNCDNDDVCTCKHSRFSQ